MNMPQKNIGFAVGFPTAVAAVVLYMLAVRLEPSLNAHLIFQIANILTLSAIVSVVSAVHAWLAELAGKERHEQLEFDEKDRSLFGDEIALDGRHQQAYARFRRFIIPLLIVFISSLEFGLAFWVVRIQRSHKHDILPNDLSPLLVNASVLAVLGAILFLVGRYCAAEAYRGGRGYLRPLSGTTLLGGIACFLGVPTSLLHYWRFPVYTDLATWFTCATSMAIAAERLLQWVMDFYRPKSRESDVDIPVYESRILALFSQPEGIVKNVVELIDYQFGFRISEDWIIGFVSRCILPFLLLQLLTMVLLTTIVHVQPTESAVVDRWGRTEAEILPSGLHFRMPWPVSRIQRLDTQSVRRLRVLPGTNSGEADGSIPTSPYTWDNETAEAPLYLCGSLSDPPTDDARRRSETQAVSLAAASITVQYRIHDPIRFALLYTDPASLLTLIWQRELTHYLAAHKLDDLMYDDVRKKVSELRSQMQSGVDRRQLGVTIERVTMDYFHPPPQVTPAYREVINTRANSQIEKLKAQTHASRISAEAEHLANRIIREAEADTALIENLAEVEKDNYLRQRTIHRKFPELFETRAAMDALEKWLAEIEKIVVATDSPREVINVELKKTQADILSMPLP